MWWHSAVATAAHSATVMLHHHCVVGVVHVIVRIVLLLEVLCMVHIVMVATAHRSAAH